MVVVPCIQCSPFTEHVLPLHLTCKYKCVSGYIMSVCAGGCAPIENGVVSTHCLLSAQQHASVCAGGGSGRRAHPAARVWVGVQVRRRLLRALRDVRACHAAWDPYD